MIMGTYRIFFSVYVSYYPQGGPPSQCSSPSVMIATLHASRARRIPGNAASERKDQMPEITTQWRRFDEVTVAELYELLRFRQSIFVVEQGSAYPDLDGLDQSAWHL